jgi:hypothetical protein
VAPGFAAASFKAAESKNTYATTTRREKNSGSGHNEITGSGFDELPGV